MSQVRFHECVYVRDTISLDELSHEEVESTWYSPIDFDKMRKRQEALLEVFEEAPADVKDYVSKIYGVGDEMEQLERVQACWDAVLHEQDKQWNRERFDPVRIARLSRSHSVKSEVDARMRGSDIAREILV